MRGVAHFFKLLLVLVTRTVFIFDGISLCLPKSNYNTETHLSNYCTTLAALAGMFMMHFYQVLRKI